MKSAKAAGNDHHHPCLNCFQHAGERSEMHAKPAELQGEIKIRLGAIGLSYVKPVKRIKVKIATETEGSKTATVKLDDEQMLIIKELLCDLKENIDYISVEPQTQGTDEADMHAPSLVMRSVLATFFVMISIALVYGLVVSWNVIVAANSLLTGIVMAVFLGIVAIASLVIGFSIGSESSKTYIVSLFSSVVALVALGVAFFK